MAIPDIQVHDIPAVILAGGQGVRLRSCVTDRPKPMALVAGRPFLEWLLLRLRRWGVREVVLCVGYGAHQIRRYFSDGTWLDMEIRYAQEESPLGTAGALRLALPFLDSDPVLVLNGDSYCDAPLDHFLASHCQRGADGSLLLVKVPDPLRYGTVGLNSEGRIMTFHEKAAPPVGAWINAGQYLFARELVATIPAGVPLSLEHEIIPRWLARRLVGFSGHWPFLDIGTPESYRQADAFFQSACLADVRPARMAGGSP
ncbi:MAG: nucleotidyltransferase family protein [Nitrospirota bacterium]